MLHKIIDFLASLRLTVGCLACALVLVFIGTLAQVNLGIYIAQERYFQSLFVMWSPQGAEWKIPVWPGGYLLGSVLLANLLVAHFKRFKYTKKKAGILLVHGGLIILLLGQLFTELLQVETFMRLTEGESKNYTESGRDHELAVINVSDEKFDDVVAIPETLLEAGRDITHPSLPFTIKVKKYSVNSTPVLVAPMKGVKADATGGAGLKMSYTNIPPAIKMNDRNIPSAVVEIAGAKGSGGTWLVSNWVAERQLAALVQQQWQDFLGTALAQPQRFEYDGKTYELALRSKRIYKPYSIELVDFTHEKYRGTEIPKNFASRVRLLNPGEQENREVLIYMNNPLRYGGETYYQGSFDERDDRVSILQVVRNPSWLTPYVAVTAVGAGLLIQFLSHLFAFSKRRIAQ